MTKQQKIEKTLLDSGYISNIDTLNGAYGFRTNRLGAFIHNLRKKYVIVTTIKKDMYNNYEDCIYTMRGKI